MIKIFPLFFMYLISNFANAQINFELKKELDEIFYLDQKYRALFDNSISESKKDSILVELKISKEDFYSKSWMLVIEQDSINLKKIEKIISEYGYPGKTLVGEKSNESAWLVIQHSNAIEKYFPLIKKAGEEGEISKKCVAMMQDRLLMQKGEEQIYGTQIKGERLANSEFIYFVWPIKNNEEVNKRRNEMGFENTIEEYAQHFDIEYKVITLDDVKRMKSQSIEEE